MPQPDLHAIDTLTAFLPKLYAEGFKPIRYWNTQNADGSLALPWPVYDDTVTAFYTAVGAVHWLPNQPVDWKSLAYTEAFIQQANLAQVQAMLTQCVRKERFCDGHWATMIENGSIRWLLERLITIRAEMSKPGMATRLWKWLGR